MQKFIIALSFIATTHLAQAANVLWTNTSGGNWSATNNWNPHQVPGSGDVAVITNDANYTVTLDATLPAGGLVLGTAGGVNKQVFLVNGQTFTLNGTAVIGASGRFTLTNNDVLGGNVVLTGALTCAGGTFSGALTVSGNSVLTATLPGMNLNSFFGSSVMLTNYGTVNWNSGDIQNNYSPVVYNFGLWNAQTNGAFFGRLFYGNSVFNNYGTFRKSGGSGTSTVDANTTFNTTGTMDVQTGVVLIQGGIGSGILSVAGGATASFGTRYLFTGSNAVSGSGVVAGFLIGSNAVFSGTVNCSGDTLSGGLTISSNSVLNLGATSVTFDTFYGGSGVLTNYGTVNWGAGNLNCNNSPVIYNYGLWNAQTNNSLFGRQFYGNAVFNNYGSFRKSGGSGTSAVDVNTTFNTSGTVDVQTGAMQIEGGTGSGALSVAGSASASFGTRYLFTGSNVVSGSGIVVGFLIGSNAVFSGTVNCSGDTLSGALTISSNSVLNLGASSVTFDTFYGGSGSLTNYGTVNWGAGDIDCNNSPSIYNYGLWNAQADKTLVGENPYGNTTFNNYGTFRKSSGSGASAMDANTTFNTSGKVDVLTGAVQIDGGTGAGVLNIAGSASASFGVRYIFVGSNIVSGSGTIGGFLIGSKAVFSGTLNCSGNTLSGTLTISSNGVLNLGASSVTFDTFYGGSGSLTNYGTVNWGAGNLSCNNSPVIYNYGLWNAQTDNTLVGQNPYGITTFNNYGTFRKSAGSGTSTMDGYTTFNTPGTMDVQTGTLGLLGSHSLTGGTFDFGINSSNSFGTIYLNGGSALTGTLNLSFNNGYVPALGTTVFPLFSYGSESGTFATLNLPSLPSKLLWQTNYGATVFTLSVVIVPLPQLVASPSSIQHGTNFSLTFGTVPGQTYQVQYTTNLAPANWINLDTPFTATDSTKTVLDLIGLNPQRFYRVILP